jgi:hypothetical protein
MTIHTDPNAAHAVYAPSSADRWIPCTASAEAIARLPEQEEGEEAAEGTAAHEEIERIMIGEMDDPTWLDVDPEHPAAYGIALLLSFCRQLPPGVLWIEQRVALTDQIWGRCDVAHWHAESGVLTIVDYKNGMRAVDAEENSQLRIYAAASMFTHKLPVKWIRYVVVQPNDWRPFVPRVKQWHEPVEALYDWAGMVAAIPRGVKSFIAGDHCRDCPLFGKCQASLDMLANFGAVIAGLVAPEAVRPEQVALYLALEKPITDQIKKFKKHWETAALKSGTVPPDMKIVTTRPHRQWLDVSKARAAVIEKCGVDALDPPTPAQAEKLGVDISSLADRPDGGPALAFANDKRPEWKRKSAAEMFGSILSDAGAAVVATDIITG